MTGTFRPTVTRVSNGVLQVRGRVQGMLGNLLCAVAGLLDNTPLGVCSRSSRRC